MIKTNITNVDFDNDVDTINDSCDDELWGVALCEWKGEVSKTALEHPRILMLLLLLVIVILTTVMVYA